MNICKNLKIGTTVYLEIENRGKNNSVTGTVLKAAEKEALVVLDKQDISLELNSLVRVKFADIFACYRYTCRLSHSVILDSGFPCICLSHPSQFKRIQNREYVRVPYSLEVILTYKDNKDLWREFMAKTSDISGGGLMLVLLEQEPVSRGLEINFTLKIGISFVSGRGKVIWTAKRVSLNGNNSFLAGIKITHISEADRRVIIKFVNEKQIELRRKGLL